ncbi:PREDICTED: mitochondrial dicarboxylate/tricarboxylate transporter DTC-like [Nelumbo nucifera]|uniref:Mitochondrial dicarboxylate/tricarboxylate transporter DTC-like n=1 Tax=Nelumbo nucifera TaxID=4432 RepID=A0A1U7ZKA3_NELNU|nr:PREDICTED: mitochondrial dicarboxylate/tricarboxylate transporter DTC-like [Nelumbo nucifera]
MPSHVRVGLVMHIPQNEYLIQNTGNDTNHVLIPQGTIFLASCRALTNKAVAANDGKPLPLYQKALCGLTAGAIGACVGSPADLALIRMQADATLPSAQRRNYTNAFHALYRIVADEGVLALWKGAGPTVVRAMALNMGMLASYDQSVEFFKDSLGFGEASTVVGKMVWPYPCY